MEIQLYWILICWVHQMMTTHRFGLWYATSCPPETSNIQCRCIGRYQIRLNHTKRLRTSASHSNLLFSGKGHWQSISTCSRIGTIRSEWTSRVFLLTWDASAQSLDEHELTSYLVFSRLLLGEGIEGLSMGWLNGKSAGKYVFFGHQRLFL